jgi:hypothetical protein
MHSLGCVYRRNERLISSVENVSKDVELVREKLLNYNEEMKEVISLDIDDETTKSTFVGSDIITKHDIVNRIKHTNANAHTQKTTEDIHPHYGISPRSDSSKESSETQKCHINAVDLKDDPDGDESQTDDRSDDRADDRIDETHMNEVSEVTMAKEILSNSTIDDARMRSSSKKEASAQDVRFYLDNATKNMPVKWEIPTNEITMGIKIAEGTSGKVR